MDRIAKALRTHDGAYHEVAQILFGDGADELIRKVSPDQSDVSSGGQRKPKEWERKVGYATNMAGAIGGPAAIWQATKNRKGGGIPRDVLRSIGRSKKRGKISQGALKIAENLDTPGGRRAKIGAGVAGASMVGLQGANWAGDTIAARALRKQPEEKKKVSKGDIQVPTNKGQLVAMGVEKVPQVVEAGNAQQYGDKLKARSGHLVKRTKKSTQDKWAKSQMKAHLSKSDDTDVVWEGEFSKMDTDRQQVFGWASVVEVNGQPVHDLQGDIIDLEEIEKAAYSYVQKSRKGGDNHRRIGDQPYHASDMIESFIVTPEKKQALGLPDSVPSGWWVGFQVHDPEVWAEVKKGKRTGFSIHGRGKRREA